MATARLPTSIVYAVSQLAVSGIFVMQKSPEFKQCTRCRVVFFVSGRHKSYLICLGEGHVKDKCLIYTSFLMRTKEEEFLKNSSSQTGNVFWFRV